VTERPLPIIYKGVELHAKYRIDLLVEDLVLVEVKSIDCLTDVHKAQVLTYMRLAGSPAGLLINFNVAKLIDGVRRLIETRR
jgi:GxxExxY protein